MQLVYNLKDRKLVDIDVIDLQEMSHETEKYQGYVFMDNSSFVNIHKRIVSVRDTYSIDAVRRNPLLLTHSVLDFIQSVVIYENIVTDGYVLANNTESYELAWSFRDVVKALWMEDDVRDKIVKEIRDEAKRLEDKITNEKFEIIKDSYSAFADRSVFDGFNEERFIGEVAVTPYHITTFDIPAELQTSDNHVLRTLYYDQVSTLANIPYSPHLGRKRILEVIQKERINSARFQVMNHVESKLEKIRNEMGLIYSGYNTNLRIPLVAEYIVKRAGSFDEIMEILRDIRNSKEAMDFRKWCDRFQEALTNGQMGTVETQKIFSQLEKSSQRWMKHTRNLTHSTTLKMELGLKGPSASLSITLSDFIQNFFRYNKLRLLKKVIQNKP